MTDLSADQVRLFREWIAGNGTKYNAHCLSRRMTGLDSSAVDADADADADAAGDTAAPCESTGDHGDDRGGDGGDAASVEGQSAPISQRVPLLPHVWENHPEICRMAWHGTSYADLHRVATLVRDVEFSNTALDPSGGDPTAKFRLPAGFAWTCVKGKMPSCAHPPTKAEDEAVVRRARQSGDADSQSAQEDEPEPWSPDLLALHAYRGDDGQWVTSDAASSSTELLSQARAGSEFSSTSADSNASEHGHTPP